MFVPIIREKDQPGCKSCRFFCVIHDKRNWWDNCVHTKATVAIQPPLGAWSMSIVVPTTRMVFPSTETNSIMLVVSGCITRLCFFAKFSLMQSTEASVSGNSLRVARLSSSFFFIFIFKLTIRVGQPAIAAEFAAGLDMEHFVFVVCLTMFAVLTVKDIFFFLLFLMLQYGHVQSPSWMTCVPYSYFDLLDEG